MTNLTAHKCRELITFFGPKVLGLDSMNWILRRAETGTSIESLHKRSFKTYDLSDFRILRLVNIGCTKLRSWFYIMHIFWITRISKLHKRSC